MKGVKSVPSQTLWRPPQEVREQPKVLLKVIRQLTDRQQVRPVPSLLCGKADKR